MDAVKTGALIVQVRREKELTQKDLAERLHVSTQAVSKWERGLSCPDIALLEPLAEALELTVTELLSGQRGEEPGEEAVRESLRFGQNQLGPKVKRWRWLFVAAALVLAGVLLRLGYLWVRDNTELLPQRETVVKSLTTSEQEEEIARALGGSANCLHLYEVTLADSFTGCTIQAELWTYEGIEVSWPLLSMRSDDQQMFGPRRQLLVLSLEPHDEMWSEEEQRWTRIWFDYGISFDGYSSNGPLGPITNRYINGATVWSPMEDDKVAGQGEDLILLTISMGGPNNGTYAPGGLPPEHKESVYLVVRMYCE